MAFLAIVTAAGRSRRMGGVNKLLMPLGGEPLLLHSLRRLDAFPALEAIVVSAPEGDEDTYRELFQGAGLTRVRAVVTGGAERQESIFHAIRALEAAPDDVLAIHDAARPFLTHALLARLLDALSDWDGVLPVVPVKDTIKSVRCGGVEQTLPREQLVAAQTPQVFSYSVIYQAHAEAARQGYLGTDDCSLVEWRGGRIGVVEGDYRNLKVTTPEDLVIAERLLQQVV
ncbi:MAG: 2-C-methyl-D-erythritol 4-phosphate cytidylyltransferase [Candidatus Eremiobacterota bacterium]